MTNEDNERHIATLREKSREERARLAALSSKLGDLKQWLTQASSQLDFIDHFFLDPKILSEDRTPEKLARWLSGADAALKIAVEVREHVEGLASKFGPDARLIRN